MQPITSDVRCPYNPARLFLRLKHKDPTVAIVPGNLIEVACRDCRDLRRRDGEGDVKLVLHRYNAMGRHVETEVVRTGS